MMALSRSCRSLSHPSVAAMALRGSTKPNGYRAPAINQSQFACCYQRPVKQGQSSSRPGETLMAPRQTRPVQQPKWGDTDGTQTNKASPAPGLGRHWWHPDKQGQSCSRPGETLMAPRQTRPVQHPAWGDTDGTQTNKLVLQPAWGDTDGTQTNKASPAPGLGRHWWHPDKQGQSCSRPGETLMAPRQTRPVQHPALGDTDGAQTNKATHSMAQCHQKVYFKLEIWRNVPFILFSKIIYINNIR